MAFEETVYNTFCKDKLESDQPKVKFYDKIRTSELKSLVIFQRSWKGK